MTLKRWLLFTSIILTLQGFTQTANDKVDAQILFSLDVFTSKNEMEAFQRLGAGKDINYLGLFLNSDSDFTKSNSLEKINGRIDAFLTTAGYTAKSGYKTKELKKIYKDIHDAFFTKYLTNPMFSQVFADGGYNCATATALYAVLLEKLSINYNISETPDHVYIIADPQNNHVIFETTTPGSVVYTINEKEKIKFVEYLYNNKLISKEDWLTKDKKLLFEQHYYSDEPIDKRKLAGLLYYNLAVDNIASENYKAAYKNLEKANFLYPSARIQYFLSVCLVNTLLKDGMQENEAALPYYLRLLEVFNKDAAADMMKEYTEAVTKKLLFKSAQQDKYVQFYQSIKSGVKDSSLMKYLHYAHCYHTAHYYSIKGKFDSSLLYLDSVYAINKDDLLVQELVAGTVEEILRKIGENEQALMRALDSYFVRYPFLEKNNTKLKDVYAYCLCKASPKAYQTNMKKEGDTFLFQVATMMDKQPELVSKVEMYFANAVVEAYYRYIRQREYKDAKAFLVKMIKYVPTNEEVKTKMKRIDEILVGK